MKATEMSSYLTVGVGHGRGNFAFGELTEIES